MPKGGFCLDCLWVFSVKDVVSEETIIAYKESRYDAVDQWEYR